jgi:hypothetical protein
MCLSLEYLLVTSIILTVTNYLEVISLFALFAVVFKIKATF